jgi:hypothetical protein
MRFICRRDVDPVECSARNATPGTATALGTPLRRIADPPASGGKPATGDFSWRAGLAERTGVDRAYASGLDLGHRNPTVLTLYRQNSRGEGSIVVIATPTGLALRTCGSYGFCRSRPDPSGTQRRCQSPARDRTYCRASHTAEPSKSLRWFPGGSFEVASKINLLRCIE